MKKARVLEVHWHDTKPICSKACRRDLLGILTGPMLGHVCPQETYVYWGCCCQCWFMCAVGYEVFLAYDVPDDVANSILGYVSDKHFVEEYSGPSAKESGVFCPVCKE